MVELLKTYGEDLTKKYRNNELQDYLKEEEFYEYEFTVSLTSNGFVYKSACITLACGGPIKKYKKLNGEPFSKYLDYFRKNKKYVNSFTTLKEVHHD